MVCFPDASSGGSARETAESSCSPRHCSSARTDQRYIAEDPWFSVQVDDMEYLCQLCNGNWKEIRDRLKIFPLSMYPGY